MQNFRGAHERDIQVPAFSSHSSFFVLLRHDRAGERGFPKPYHIEPMDRYCARPPGNPTFKLFGIYASEEKAWTAMCEDARRLRVLKKRDTA